MTETSYDIVPYTSHALSQTHPDRLAALARLFGMRPRDITQSRILEIGCGDGSNLIPMSYGLPHSELIGIDMAEGAISSGQEIQGLLGLKNLRLLAMDLMDVDDAMGLFDYIICHGVFSWVGGDAREKILGICRNNLAPQGVAYVSYNIYPGWHLRNMVRGMMRFHTDHFPDPKQKVSQARAILQFIAEAVPESLESYRKVLTSELQQIMDSEILFHDDLAEINHPLYFHEFMAMAEEHGLKFLAESDFFEMQDQFFDDPVRETLKRLSGQDILVKEQFMDFIKGRRFRQTLLHHAGETLNRRLQPGTMEGFLFSCPARPVDGEGKYLEGNGQDLLTREDLHFRRPRGSTIGTDHPVPRAALLTLSKIWPARLHFDQLLAVGRELARQFAREQGLPDRKDSEEDPVALGDVLLSAFSANMVEIHVHSPRFSEQISSRPVASPYARIQAQKSTRVTNLCHKTIELKDTYGRILLPLLDGALGMDDIRAKALKRIRDRDLSLKGNRASEKTDSTLLEEIDEELRNCARHALLIA